MLLNQLFVQNSRFKVVRPIEQRDKLEHRLHESKHNHCRVKQPTHYFLGFLVYIITAGSVGNSLFDLLHIRIDVQAQTLVVQVELVAAAVVMQDLGDVPGILDLSQFDVTLVLLDRVTNEFC